MWQSTECALQFFSNNFCLEWKKYWNQPDGIRQQTLTVRSTYMKPWSTKLVQCQIAKRRQIFHLVKWQTHQVCSLLKTMMVALPMFLLNLCVEKSCLTLFIRRLFVLLVNGSHHLMGPVELAFKLDWTAGFFLGLSIWTMKESFPISCPIVDESWKVLWRTYIERSGTTLIFCGRASKFSSLGNVLSAERPFTNSSPQTSHLVLLASSGRLESEAMFRNKTGRELSLYVTCSEMACCPALSSWALLKVKWWQTLPSRFMKSFPSESLGLSEKWPLCIPRGGRRCLLFSRAIVRYRPRQRKLFVPTIKFVQYSIRLLAWFKSLNHRNRKCRYPICALLVQTIRYHYLAVWRKSNRKMKMISCEWNHPKVDQSWKQEYDSSIATHMLLPFETL